MKNQINTSEGNVQFITPDGKLMNVHPSHVYAVFNQDTVSFLLIAMPKSSGLAVFTTTAEDLLFNGETYTFEQLKTVIPEAFAEAGAQARCEIVDELPETGKTNTIYLVPKEEGEGYDEYIYLKDEQRWELIGDTSIEMDNYVKKVDFSAYTASTQEVIDGLVSDLETESANRISGDSQLSTAIENEAQRAVSAETANANAITAETLNRTTADNALQTQITANANAIATKADKANAVASAEYIESNHIINFKNVNGAIISYIDASAFVVDGMVNDAYVRGDKLVITFNTDAGKQNIEIPLSDIFNPDNYYTKAQVNDRYYTKSECDSKYVTEEYVSGLTDNFYTKDEINSIESVQNSKIDAVSGDIQTLNDEIQTISGESMTSGEVETMIDEAVSGKADTSAVTEAITAAVSGKADADSVYSKTESDNKYQTKGDYVTGAQMSAYTYDKQTIDDKIAQGGTFDPTQYYNKTQTNELLADKANTATTYTKSEVDSAVSGKQDTLVSGTNIKTINNTSILGSGNIDIQGGPSYSAGSGIDITNDVISVTGKVDTDTYTAYTAATDSALAGKADTATTDTLNTALTSHTSSSDIHVTVNDKNVWNGKQNQLTAGTGISIVNDVISVTASSPTVDAYTKAESDAKFATITNFNTHSGDTNVHVTSTEKNTWNNKSDFSGSYNDLTNKPTIPTIWTGTQAEFDAITVKDPTTLYLIR